MSDPLVPLVPQKHGGALKRGGGSHAARSRDASKAGAVRILQQILRDKKCEERVRAILLDPEGDPRAFIAMWQAAWDRAYGRPRESIELSGSVGATIEHVPTRILLPPLEPAPVIVAAPPAAFAYSALLPPDPALAPDVATEELND